MASQRRDLTVGYSTLPDRVHRIAVPAIASDCVVVIQTGGGHSTRDLDAEVERLQGAGARVVVLDSIGVARSRNEVLRQARTRYVLFGDDDVVIDDAGVDAALAHLAATEHALALGRAVDEHGRLRKDYTSQTTPLTLYNSAKAATYEMLVDVEQTRRAEVWFDERFGAGADLYLGDEYIFIADMLRAGLAGDAVPITVAMHPEDSSGSRWGTDRDIDARSAALSRAVGARAWWVKPLFAARHVRTIGLRGALRFLRPARY